MLIYVMNVFESKNSHKKSKLLEILRLRGSSYWKEEKARFPTRPVFLVIIVIECDRTAFNDIFRRPTKNGFPFQGWFLANDTYNFPSFF
jgi:hypothetical protein